MRVVLSILSVVLFTLCGVSQAPRLINYQGLARDYTGVPITATVIGLKFEIKDAGTTVFTEMQTVSTNTLGLFSTQIGSTTGSLSINWQSGSYSLQVSMDVGNTGNFVSLGAPQALASVPYALHAASVPASYTNNVLTIGSTTIALPTSPTPSIAGAGLASVSPASGSSFTVTVPAPTLAIASGSIGISGGNTVALPQGLPQASVSGSGIAQVTTPGTNTFNVSVPAQSLALTNIGASQSQLSLSSSNAVTLTSFPQTSLTANSGIALITTPGTNTFNINVPAPTLSISTNTLSIVGSNSVILPAVIVPTITGTGLVNTSSSAYNFSVNVPLPTYNGSALAFGSSSGANTLVIAPTLSLSGSVLSSGIGSNSVNISATGPFRQVTAGTVSLTTTTDNLSLGTPGLPTAKLDVRGTATGSAVVRVINANSANTAAALDVATDGSQAVTVNNTNATGAGASFNVQDGQALSAQSTGSTSNTFYAYNTSTAVGTFAGYFKGGFVTESKSASSAHFALKAQSTGSVDLFVVRGDGNIGINTTTPAQKLDVNGSVKITDGQQADGRVLVSDAAGKGTWKSSPAALSFGNLNQSSIIASSVSTPLATNSMTFTKQSASSEVDVALYSRIYAGTFSGSVTAVYFEINVDGAASGTASSVYVIAGSGTTEYVTLRSVFAGLLAGTHTITISARTNNATGTASGVLADPGGLGGKVIVKELF